MKKQKLNTQRQHIYSEAVAIHFKMVLLVRIMLMIMPPQNLQSAFHTALKQHGHDHCAVEQWRDTFLISMMCILVYVFILIYTEFYKGICFAFWASLIVNSTINKDT